MKKYKAKLKYDFAIGLLVVIDDALATVYPGTDADKLWLAALTEIKMRLCAKMIDWQKEFKLSFTPVQAIALRLLFSEMEIENQYTRNRLHQIANEVHQHYSSTLIPTT